MSGLIVVAAVAAAALAPRACPVDPMDAPSKARAAFFIASLHPIGPQQEACGAYVRALAVTSKKEENVEENELTLPQRFIRVISGLEGDLADLRIRSDAAFQFYTVLTPPQRAILNRITLSSNPKSANAADPVEQPSMADYGSRSSSPPEWLIKPGNDILARVYPSKARAQQTEGSAQIQCTVDTDGYAFDCSVLKETPKASGFGNAALEATGYMRFAPATFHGAPVTAPVTIPIHFLPYKNTSTDATTQ